MTGAAVAPGLRCQNVDCVVAATGRCARAAEFEDPLAECPDLDRSVEAARSVQTPASALATGAAAPWSGKPLDQGECEALLARTPARLLAVLGLHGAGKTCLLTSFFLQLADGQRGEFPYRFASSLTLHGFGELAERASQWRGQGEIVGHTPLEDERPGRFLHLGFRPAARSDERHIDVLCNDTHGEIINAFIDRVDERARRLLGFLSRADGFLVIIDAEALFSADGTKQDARNSLLVQRAIDEAKQTGRADIPLALVFTKFDRLPVDQVVPVDRRLDPRSWGSLGARAPRIFAALRRSESAGVRADVFAASAFPRPMQEGQPIGVMAPFHFFLLHADRRRAWSPWESPISDTTSAFAAMRRWRIE